MFVLRGVYYTILHPRLLIIPLALNVCITFLAVLGAYFGFSITPYHIPIKADQISGTFPIWIPFLVDIQGTYHSIQVPETNFHWFLTPLASILIIILTSYALAIYLGSIKGFFIGLDNTYSLLKIGKFYFKRMLLFTFIASIASGLVFLLGTYFLPLGILGILALLIFSLTPYLIVLEDLTVIDAIKKAPNVFRRTFFPLFALAIICILVTNLLSSFTIENTYIRYYVYLLLYSFIGTTFIFAVMEYLHSVFFTYKRLPFKVTIKSKLYYPLLLIAVFTLPLFGAWLATGRFLLLFE